MTRLESAAAMRAKYGKKERKGKEMKQAKVILFRQGDVLFRQIVKLPAGERKRRENGVVAYGEVTGHSHALAIADSDKAEVLEIADRLFVRVSDDGIGIDGECAVFQHEEHSPIALPPGNYAITIQREYEPEGIRNVAD